MPTTVVSLATLSASRGFRIDGGSSSIGISGVGAGDVNGDGISDLIIGSFNEGSSAGAAYVVYGHSGQSGTVTLSSLSASAGFRIGGAANSSFGLTAAGIGDVNGDGLADIAIGGNGSNTAFTGEVAVIFGKVGGYTSFNVSSITSATGIRIFGPNNSTAELIARIGDFNGDGRPDFVIGATEGPITGAGGAYVIFGTASGQFPTSINLANLGSAGVRITGAAAGDNSGWVSAAGDFNKDGLADFVIGAPLNDAAGNNAGAAYVVYGRAGTTTINLTSLGTGGLTIIGDKANDATGGTLGGGFDFNGDGWSDIIVNGQRTYGSQAYAYVVFGRSGGAASVDLTSLNSSSPDGFVLLGSTALDALGAKVSSAGDLNGDGFGDIIVSATADGHATGNVYNGVGAIYVIYGHAGAQGPLDVTNLSASQGFKLVGTGFYSAAGQAISSAGDVNFDGVNDIIVSADYNNLYVVYGVSSNTAPVLNPTATPVLTSVNENAGAPVGAVGTLVSSLVDSTNPAGGHDNVTDVDGPSLGIALTGTNTTNGSWFYSINGGTSWNSMGAVSDGGARLLLADASTRLYFQPSPAFDGTVSSAITFRAWDGSAGSNGGLASTSTNGGTSAFSTATDTANLTVIDVPTVSINNVTQLEGSPIFTFTVSLSAQSTNTVTVSYATSGGTATLGTDFTGTSGVVTFLPNETSHTVNVSVANDAVYEANENFTVSLSNANNATIASVTGTGTITNDDAAPVFNFSSPTYSIAEGNAGTTVMTFTVTKTGATELASSVNFATSNGSATTANLDYVANIGTLNFAAGDTFKTFNVTINGDTTTEPNETFNVGLNTPLGGTIGAQSTAVATITNDDNAPPTATNLNAAESYTEDQTALNLTDIVVTDTDSANVTVTLTLSNTAAGTLSTGTSNAVTSAFVGGVWTASGATADVNALLAGVTFSPASNFNASFNLATSVSDGTSTITGTKAFTGIPVNDPPVATGESYSVNEDGSLTVGGSGVLGNDTDVENSPLNAVLGGGPVHGSLTLNTNGSFVYTPDANYNGPDSFSYRPNDGAANGNLVTVNLTVNSVNDAPVGANVTKMFSEDTNYVFTTADFGFTDPNDTPANAFANVRIASFATTGIVYLDSDGSGPNAPVNQNAAGAGMYISFADIAAGHLYYTPVANAVGSSAFTFQVTDDGGTTNSGANIDPTARTFTLTTTSVNDAPAGLDAVLTINEDTPRSFTASDFGFSDPNDSPVNALLGVKITTLPTAGTLTLDGSGLSAGDFVAVADIPDLVFTPALNANGTGYATFNFQVQDNGGTTNSGADLDASANTIGFNVTSVNDAPAGANATLSVVEGTSRVLTAADFGYSDVEGNGFTAIRVSALPGAGLLTFDADGSGPGVPVSASVGQIVTIADINAGKLTYVTPSGVNNGATNFSFQVQDNGGTADGGIDLDASPNTISYTLTPVTPPGPPPPVTIGNTTYVEADYVQPANDPATVITPRNQSDNIALNITGNAGSETIIGNYGPNILTDGGGVDTLVGLLNNDTYVVSNSGTVVVENNGEGTDTVLTSTSYILPTGASIENLSALPASGTAPIFLTGNGADQRITGNAGDNIINGLGGSDTMVGLGGNDVYLVRGPGDVVIEANGEGSDTVYTTVSYNLGANEVEVLSTVTHTDTTPINLIGNYLSQTIIGNYGDNLLNGGSGIDTLVGLFGNDLYAVGDSRIVIVETDGQGIDTVVTSVSYTLGTDVSAEVLSAQDRSSTTGLSLTGNRFGQTIAGTEGADTINGGLGSDVLIGGGGGDRFDFTTLLGSSNVDAITDFGSTDRIGLSSATFGAIGGTLDAGEFVIGSAAADADDRIIYNQTTGQIFYDADGNGAGLATLFAVVTPGTLISASNFEVIAP